MAIIVGENDTWGRKKEEKLRKRDRELLVSTATSYTVVVCCASGQALAQSEPQITISNGSITVTGGTVAAPEMDPTSALPHSRCSPGASRSPGPEAAVCGTGVRYTRPLHASAIHAHNVSSGGG
jgi:hypothetical protein